MTRVMTLWIDKAVVIRFIFIACDVLLLLQTYARS